MKSLTLRFGLISVILIMICCFAAYPQSKLAEGAAKGVSSVIRTNKSKKAQTKNPAKSSNQKKSQNYVDSNRAKGYIDILDIEFANTDNNGVEISKFGSKLYASEIKYLKPKIVYEGLGKDPHEIELQVSIFNSEGELLKGTTSPEGYTYISKFTENPGKNEQLISGWGTSQGGTYKPGEYRIEISYKENKVYTKVFRLYSGETPIIDNPILEVKNITYCSTDKNNIKLTEYGADLYEYNLYYLTGNMEYVGKYKNDQSIQLHIKIFNSDGNLIKGANSPSGFTYSTNITIKHGSNSISTGGYGSSNGRIYSPGKIKLEYWLDGDKIYENWVNVKRSTVSSPDYVDLGLPSGTLWATCNVGANNPEDAGLYFAWGETEPKSRYTHSNSICYNRSMQSLYNNAIMEPSGILFASHDGASVKLGASWRMPTVSEMTELDEKCKWTWTSINGVNGFKLTGPNGNSIFLPATGWYNSAKGGILEFVGERSEYWTSSAKSGSDTDAHCLFFMNPDTHYATTGHYTQRSRGLTIRPVYIRNK